MLEYIILSSWEMTRKTSLSVQGVMEFFARDSIKVQIQEISRLLHLVGGGG